MIYKYPEVELACTAARISKHLPVDVVESRRNVLYQAISLQIFTLLGAIEPVVAEAASRLCERGQALQADDPTLHLGNQSLPSAGLVPSSRK